MAVYIDELNKKIMQDSIFVSKLLNEVSKVLVGQKYVLERMLIGLLSDGHILLEGFPGLAKTLAVKSLSAVIQADYKRIQFTPDLLPADVVGTLIYNPQSSDFVVKKGPVFANIVLADEINRAPAKVQSALLEAMQERHVTIGDTTYGLPDPFLVMATQNPIEQEGTYPLPEAQVDRFMLKLKVSYPNKSDEKIILERMTRFLPKINPIISLKDVQKAKDSIEQIYVDDKVKNYIVDIVFASRNPGEYGLKDLRSLIAYGASPRATISLTLASKAYAFLQGRGYVIPEDIKIIGHDVLRHRILITYEAEADSIDSDDIIEKIFGGVDVP
ncbi:ATPase AAA [Endomicrobiia bacterium]|uniref:AAA family ATPase n=1 Tax=Endomicrobium trichonymphae TaxID=1408204 RepID=UPI00086543EA|nr:MoxR family ATPase [Candidatus Endomicrobium trichonymphae]BAV58814.1 MoxR-like AAA family ATPase [Candidatus Endomicrobium trichonymphae]GHT08878.1 ATPase AAA [Endomicrobiia bacterium]GHT23010.1 ATPase AAA [Endomicrobiia bacterium]